VGWSDRAASAVSMGSELNIRGDMWRRARSLPEHLLR